jgi:hypothetical protein
VERFDWSGELQSLKPRYLQMNVARRNEDLRSIAALSNADHHWHEVFVRLQQPAPAKLGLADRIRLKNRIGELLRSLRYHNPGVEQVLDADHVALWEGVPGGSGSAELFKPDGISWFGWLLILAFAMNLIRVAVGLVQ